MSKRNEALIEKIDELRENIQQLNSKIEKMEKQSFTVSDDQFFLSSILAFVIVVISLQFNDIVNFLNLMHSGSATYSAVFLIISSVGFLGIALGLRYWATMVDDSQLYFFNGRNIFYFEYNASRLRYASLESLITGFALVAIVVLLNFVTAIPNLFIENFVLFIAVLIIIKLGTLETRILEFYKSRKLIPEESAPFAQGVFSSTGFALALFSLWFASVNFIIQTLITSPINQVFYAIQELSVIPQAYRALAILWIIVGVYLFIPAYKKYKSSLHIKNKNENQSIPK